MRPSGGLPSRSERAAAGNRREKGGLGPMKCGGEPGRRDRVQVRRRFPVGTTARRCGAGTKAGDHDDDRSPDRARHTRSGAGRHKRRGAFAVMCEVRKVPACPPRARSGPHGNRPGIRLAEQSDWSDSGRSCRAHHVAARTGPIADVTDLRDAVGLSRNQCMGLLIISICVAVAIFVVL